MVNLRRWSALAAVLGVLGLITAAPGWATEPLPSPNVASDSIDSMTIEYRVAPDGVLSVEETIVYRFGPTSGRHGIYRDLVIREPLEDADSKDQRYDVSDVQVSSPNASAEFSTSTEKSMKHRHQVLRVKIGDPYQTVTAPTATYRISYRVRGAMRYFDDHSELYWDATGIGWDASLKQARISVTGPQDVQKATCYAGVHRSTKSCDSASAAGGAAEFRQDTELPRGSGVTIVAAFPAGAVTGNGPIIEPAPSLLTRLGLSVPMAAGSGAVTLALPVGGLLLARRGSGDQRFAGLPPGTTPAAGTQVPLVRDTIRTSRLPVVFAPPEIAVAEAGLLLDGKLDTTETAATLVDLAVRGVLRIEPAGAEQRAVLVDPYRATRVHEQVLVRQLFPSLQPGSTVDLGRRTPIGDSSMRQAHDLMVAQVRQQVRERGWYLKLPPGTGGRHWQGACCLLLFAGGFLVMAVPVMVVIGSLLAGVGFVAAVVLPLLVLAITLVAVWWSRRNGRRSAAGRAVCDQVQGFRSYLATAEADQLRFEEGEDIFSKYLPWAIAFGLTDRWQRICAQLVTAGRIPGRPAWYAGDVSTFSAGALTHTVSSTFSQPPSPVSSGGGGGGFSSGSSGGSSGGGGGGGGGGSW